MSLQLYGVLSDPDALDEQGEPIPQTFTGLREFNTELVAEWRAENNPKAERLLDFISAAAPSQLGAVPVETLTVDLVARTVTQSWTLAPAPMPDITAFQLRRAIKAANRRSAFLTYVQGASEDDQDYWQFSPVFRRADTEIERMRVGLSRTQAQVDNLFYAAAQF